MPYIISTAKALPKNEYTQNEIIDALKYMWTKRGHFERVKELHNNMGVKKRFLAIPLSEYSELKGLADKNNRYIEVATELSSLAVKEALLSADLNPDQVDIIMCSTVTGLSVPSLDARVLNTMNFKSSVKRIPLFGLGCLGGMAGINRMAEYLEGHPDSVGVLFCTELCTLTFQFDDFSVANWVSTGLFADGSGAICMVGDNHPLAKSKTNKKLKWINGASDFYFNTERVMGWDFIDTGLKIVLGKEVPQVAKESVSPFVKKFLENNKFNLEDLSFYVAHPGGPKVLQALEEGLGISSLDLHLSYSLLENYGNLSSASVIFILDEVFKNFYKAGQYGLGLAMGPGFCSEASLFKME